MKYLCPIYHGAVSLAELSNKHVYTQHPKDSKTVLNLGIEAMKDYDGKPLPVS